MGVREVKIRIAKAFNGFKVGQVFDWGDGMARVFIARGVVVPAGDDKPVERAVQDQPVERAVYQPPIKRKPK